VWARVTHNLLQRNGHAGNVHVRCQVKRLGLPLWRKAAALAHLRKPLKHVLGREAEDLAQRHGDSIRHLGLADGSRQVAQQLQPQKEERLSGPGGGCAQAGTAYCGQGRKLFAGGLVGVEDGGVDDAGVVLHVLLAAHTHLASTHADVTRHGSRGGGARETERQREGRKGEEGGGRAGGLTMLSSKSS
jgi:hypothetical protein